MNTIFTIAFKDMLRSLRSFFAIGMMLGVPLLLTGLIYLAFGGMSKGDSPSFALPPLAVAVVNEDVAPAGQPDLGRMLVDFLNDERMPDWIKVSQLDSPAAARAAIDRQEIGVALLVPAGFSQAMFEADGHSSLTLLHDPTLTIGPAIIKSLVCQYLDGINGSRIAVTVISRSLSDKNLALPAQIYQSGAEAYAAWYADMQTELNHGETPAFAVINPAGENSAGAVTKNPIAAILAATMSGQMIFFAFFTGAYSMTSILREQEEGTLGRLFTTPVSRTLVLAGKFMAVFLTVALQGLTLLLISKLMFGIQWGQPLTVALATLGQVVGASGLGVFLIAFVRDSRQSGPVLGGGLTALGFLSGLFTGSIPNSPAIFETIGLFTPQGWTMRAWNVTVNGGSPAEIILPVLVLLGMGLALFAIGAGLFRRRFA